MHVSRCDETAASTGSLRLTTKILLRFSYIRLEYHSGEMLHYSTEAACRFIFSMPRTNETRPSLYSIMRTTTEAIQAAASMLRFVDDSAARTVQPGQG